MSRIRSSLCLRGLLVVIILSAGCSDRQQELFLPPIEKDVKLGHEVSERIQTEIGLYESPELRSYITRVGQRVAAQIKNQRFDYQFDIIDQTVPNAFAAPGGFVYVSRGLLLLTQSEDELANVLAHEIVHVARRHTAKQRASNTVPSILALPGHLLGAVVGDDVGQIINIPVNTVGAVFMTAYSRQDELEADELGQQLSAAAGYNPRSLGRILERMEQLEEYETQEQRQASFFDTHPTTPQRTRRIAQHAARIRFEAQPAVSAGRFLYQLDGLLLGHNPVNGVFDGQQFLHPHLDFSIEFPPGWSMSNTPLAVIAVSAERDAMIVLGVFGQGMTPEDVRESFVAQVRDEYDIEPESSTELPVGESPAQLITYVDSMKGQPVNLNFMWLSHHNLIYQFTAMVPDSSQETFRNTANSFRALSPADRLAIREVHLRVVQAQADESLVELSRRTGNVWDLQWTALINGLNTDDTLSNGQLIKIARSLPYDG